MSVRQRSIRVLVVARDRRFLRMAGVLLDRRGCEVGHLERPSELLDRVARERTDVVVLDGSDSLVATARAVNGLDALDPPVPTVVVYEGLADDPVRRLKLVPKWGAFEELMSEVERLHPAGAAHEQVVS